MNKSGKPQEGSGPPGTIIVQGASDSVLVAAVLRGDMEALGELYARYRTMVHKAIIRCVPFTAGVEAEELMHDVFLSLPTLVGGFDPGRPFRPWLYGVAMKTAMNHKKKQSLRLRLFRARTGELHWMAADAGVSPERMEEMKRIERALSTLPEAQAQVLVLHAVEGFKGEEIADILGVEVNTVWTRLHRARHSLMDALQDGSPAKVARGL